MWLLTKENRIGDKGAQSFAFNLRKNKTLKVLSLFGSIFHHHLIISDNRITDKGAEALLDALEENKTIEKIYLGGNSFISLTLRESHQ